MVTGNNLSDSINNLFANSKVFEEVAELIKSGNLKKDLEALKMIFDAVFLILQQNADSKSSESLERIGLLFETAFQISNNDILKLEYDLYRASNKDKKG